MSDDFETMNKVQTKIDTKDKEISSHTFSVGYSFVGSPYNFSIYQKPIQVSLAVALGLIDEKNTSHKLLDGGAFSNQIIGDSKKKIFLNKVLIKEIDQKFPFPINISITGNNFGDNINNDKLSIYGALVESGYKGEPDILLVSPEIPYHSENFIKTYHHVTCEDDIKNMLTYKIVEIPYYDDISEEFSRLKVDDNSRVVEEDQQDMTKSFQKNTNQYVIIKDDDSSDFIKKIKKLPKPFNFFCDEQLKSSIRKAAIDDNEQEPLCIDKSVFDTFVSNEYEFVRQGIKPISVEDLFIRIHNTDKSNNNNIAWKAHTAEPDLDQKEYEVKMLLEYTIFVI